MRYRVALHHDGEGISVSAPGLPRCWCQGRDEAEALASIADAIGEYLAARDELLRDEVEVREVEVAVSAVGKFPGVNHLHAIQGVETARFRVVREGKHTMMSAGARILTIRRHNPMNAFTKGGTVRDAGLTPEAFRELV